MTHITFQKHSSSFMFFALRIWRKGMIVVNLQQY